MIENRYPTRREVITVLYTLLAMATLLLFMAIATRHEPLTATLIPLIAIIGWITLGAALATVYQEAPRDPRLDPTPSQDTLTRLRTLLAQQAEFDGDLAMAAYDIVRITEDPEPVRPRIRTPDQSTAPASPGDPVMATESVPGVEAGARGRIHRVQGLRVTTLFHTRAGERHHCYTPVLSDTIDGLEKIGQPQGASQ